MTKPRMMKVLSAVVTLALLLSSGVAVPVTAAGEVTVSINAPAEVLPGANFTATVDIGSVTNLDATNYDISFNPAVLRLDDVTDGNIGGTVIPVDIWNETSPGIVTIVEDVPGLTGTNGTGSLAVLHFAVLGSVGQTSNITLSNGVLSNNLALEIPATWVGDSVQVVGVAKTLVSIAVTPVNPSIPLGLLQQFTATGTYSDNSTANLTPTANWTSSNTTVASISLHTGLATSLALGTTTIRATSGNITSPGVTLTVTAPVLLSIAVTPTNPSIALGRTQQFTATSTYTDASTANLTGSANWTSSNTAVATINSAGLATSVAQGTTNITASYTSVGTIISNNATLTVVSVALASIAVTPINPQIVAGLTQQFTANGTYNNATIANITTNVTWSSSVLSVATINSAGLATSLIAGTTNITATFNSISGNASLFVTAPNLLTIAVTPANPIIGLDSTQQFAAAGTYTNNTTDITNLVTWTSNDTSVAVINPGSGMAISSNVTEGTVLITATSGAISGNTTLRVVKTQLQSIAITPSPTASVAAGRTQQYNANGTYKDAAGTITTANITGSVNWVSSNTTVATIAACGLATSHVPGTTLISAISANATGNVTSDSATLTVTAAALDSVLVAPATASKALGLTQLFTAIGYYSDSTNATLTSGVTWSSSVPSVATVSSAGLATSVGVGTTNITPASTGWGSAHVMGAVLTVTPHELRSIAVTPAPSSIPLGLTQQYTAIGAYTDGSSNITTGAAWASSNTTVATINSAGLATSLAAGTTTITATSGNVTSNSATLTITPAELVSIAVTPTNPSIALGRTQQFTATGNFTNGITANITGSVTWVSSNTSVATINAAGLATALAVGTTTIRATSGSISGNTTLTVTAAELVSIAVTPPTPSNALGRTQLFTATGTYTNASTANITGAVTWSSSNTSVATINAAGLATAVGVGTTTITATSGNITSPGVTLTVTATELVSIAITPTTPSIAAGRTKQFTAIGLYTDTSTANLTSMATWESSNTAVATINSAGLATSLAAGATTITATSGSISGNTTLTVTAAELVSISVTPTNPSIALGRTQQFTATGNFTNGITANITGSVTWVSSNTTVATINTVGLTTSLAVGTTTIRAASGNITSPGVTLTVTAPVLLSIVVTPTASSVVAGQTKQFTATGNYTDASTANITGSVAWTSSNTTVATINSAGLATSLAAGTTTITATSGNVTSNSATLTITPAALVLVSIAVTPPMPTIARSLKQQFNATGTYSNNSTANLTATATWASSNTGVAAINAAGLATAIAAGTTVIRATSGSISGNTTLTVTAATTVEVNNGNTIILGEGKVVPIEFSIPFPGIVVVTGGIPVTVKGLPDLGAPANGLAAFRFDLSWNKDVIIVNSANASSTATSAGWSITPGDPNNTTGSMTVTGFTTTYSTANITLFYLSITAVGSSGNSTSINVTITTLGDKNGDPISALAVNNPVIIGNPLAAETSISQRLSSNVTGVVAVKVNINRIKNPTNNSTANITGGIGSYSATVSGTPGNAIQFLTVYGVPPFNGPTFDNVTGTFSVSGVSSPIQASNTTVAEVVPILTGNTTTSVTLTIAFQAIGAAGEPGLNAPEEHSNTITLRRGNTKDNDGVDIFDALYIAQYIVGQRPLSGINALNAASVKHDGAGGDKIDIFDALFIAQYIVGQKNAYFQ